MKTEIKNNNTVIVHVKQTKEEIIGTKLIYTVKISNYYLCYIYYILSVHMSIHSVKYCCVKCFPTALMC